MNPGACILDAFAQREVLEGRCPQYLPLMESVREEEGGGIVKIFTLDDFHQTTSLGLLPSIRYKIRYQIRCRTFFFSLRVLQKDLSIP